MTKKEFEQKVGVLQESRKKTQNDEELLNYSLNAIKFIHEGWDRSLLVMKEV